MTKTVLILAGLLFFGSQNSLYLPDEAEWWDTAVPAWRVVETEQTWYSDEVYHDNPTYWVIALNELDILRIPKSSSNTTNWGDDLDDAVTEEYGVHVDTDEDGLVTDVRPANAPRARGEETAMPPDSRW